MNDKKLISVIMPVRNSEKYLRAAIQSILDQTYGNFELLILISATSNQESLDIINSFSDARIRKIMRPPGDNLPQALNLGIKESQGVYIARMDSDDISFPRRFEMQVDFMEKNPTIGICGSWYKAFGRDGIFVNRLLTQPEDIKASLLFYTSLAHPSVMFRKEFLDKFKLSYDDKLKHSEDYELWSRCAFLFPIANIGQVLLNYRIHDKSAYQSGKEESVSMAVMIRTSLLEKIHLIPTEDDMRIHNSLKPLADENILDFLNKEEVWLGKIREANTTTPVYNSLSLSKIIYMRWKTLCGKNAAGGFAVWKKFKSSPLIPLNTPGLGYDTFKLFVKCLLASRPRDKSIV